MISFRKRALINHSESTPTDLHDVAVINFLLIGESRKKNETEEFLQLPQIKKTIDIPALIHFMFDMDDKIFYLKSQ